MKVIPLNTANIKDYLEDPDVYLITFTEVQNRLSIKRIQDMPVKALFDTKKSALIKIDKELAVDE